MDAWYLLAQSLHQFIGLCLCHMALHPTQHIVRDMLEGDVEILTDIGLLPHHSQQVPREVCRIGIVQSDPRHTRDISHLLNQFDNMLTAIDVHTIIGQFLSNDIEFLCTLLHQLAHLIKDLLHRTTLVATCNQRDSAIGTMTVTTLTDLYISIMWRGCDSSKTIPHSSFLIPRQITQQILVVELPIPPINLRNLLLKVGEVTLREAAHYKELLNPALRLGLGKLKNRIDALLLGIGNEATGIHDDDFTLWVITIVGTMIAVGLHQAHQPFTVHKILGTTQRDDINRLLHYEL